MIKSVIKKILLEFELRDSTDDEEDIDMYGDLFPENTYQKLFKIFDSDPEKFMSTTLKDLSLESPEKEFNIIYKYLTDYEERTPYYIPVVFNASEISEFFRDGEYGIQTIVKNLLERDYDYDIDYDCLDVDSWLIEKIDDDNISQLRSFYRENLDGEESEEDFIEFIESEFDSDIGCAAGDAQHSADIEYLHSEILDEINDYLSRFDGKLTTKIEKDGRINDELQYVGQIEFGELVDNPYFYEVTYDELFSSYPNAIDIFWRIIEREREYGVSDNSLLPEEQIRINEDKHFRYNGGGDIDWGYFNEILSDKLSMYK